MSFALHRKPSSVRGHNPDASPAKTVRANSPAVFSAGGSTRSCTCGGGCPRCRETEKAHAGIPPAPVLPLFHTSADKLQVGAADDPAEHEADRVADEILRSQNAPGQPAGRVMGNPVLRAPAAAAPAGGMEISSALARPADNGALLDAGTRSFFESRLGAGLGDVRVHHDGQAAASARALNARAYTLGRDIVFGAGEYAPHTGAGQRLLAHELVHTVQQRRSPALRRTVQRTTLDDIKPGLEAMGPDHKIVIDELYKHPKFVALKKFLSGCPAGKIDFKVERITSKVNGRDVDVFGGVSHPAGGGAVLTINPKMPAAIKNPMEVVDTVVHECIHLALSQRSICESKSNPFPLAADISDVPHDPELLDVRSEALIAHIRWDDRKFVAGLAAKGVTTQSGENPTEYYERHYGPSSSRPKTHYIDMNRQGLEFVTSIVSDIRAAHPKIGRETASFDNVELMKAGDLLSTRTWWNATQRSYSMQLHKDRVAQARGIDPKTFTDREYDMSAIQVVEFADSRSFDPNTSGGWGPVGGVWSCKKQSRITGKMMHTFVTGAKGSPPGGKTGYKIIQHTT